VGISEKSYDINRTSRKAERHEQAFHDLDTTHFPQLVLVATPFLFHFIPSDMLFNFDMRLSRSRHMSNALLFSNCENTRYNLQADKSAYC
jgi:hypothetical protein